MRLVRQQHQVEILVRFDQRFDDEQRLGRRHVRIHRPVREHQLALEVLGKVLVRLDLVVVSPIGILHEQALIALAPVVLVVALIVVSRFGDPDLEEIGIAEHR